MNTRALVLALLGATVHAARADYDPEWRDGCPAGNLARLPDIAHSAVDPLEPYPGTRPELAGALPQPDSAFGRTQLGTDFTLSHFASPGGEIHAAAVYGAALRGALSVAVSHWRHVRWSAGLRAALSSHHLDDGSLSLDHLGNLVVQPELRWQWVAIGSNPIDSVGDPAHPPASLRNGIAVQAILARPRDQGEAARVDGARIWRRTAFEGYLVSPRPTWGGALELRSEGVGCYAPFVHLRLSLTATEAATDPMDPSHERLVVLAPQTLSVGFALSSHASLLVQYGLLVYLARSEGASERSPIGATAIHRFRLGGERVFANGRLTMSGYLDLFAGSALYDGTNVGFSMTWNLGD